MKIRNVTLDTNAKAYYCNEGVISHHFTTASGKKKSAGVVFPGTYTFTTGCRERIRVMGGDMVARIGDGAPRRFGPGKTFDVPANTLFAIKCAVSTEYVCTYIK